MASQTTFDLPNFVGELFSLTPKETPFLTMSGGISGGRGVDSKEFTWQDYDLASAAVPDILEGADPVYSARARAQRQNVVQIFQRGVDITYTKLAAVGQLGTPSAAAAPIMGNQPVQNEMTWQMQRQIEQAALDVNYTFWNGTYAYPTDNLTSRKTRGIIAALSGGTEVQADAGAGAPDAIDKAYMDALLLAMHTAGAVFRDVVLWTTALQAQRLADAYSVNLASQPRDRNRFGVNLMWIVTQYGEFPVVIDRHVPAGELLAVDMSVVKPVFLAIPGKGHFFVEPLAKTGAAEKAQLYGEIGLEYGPTQWHGRLYNLTTT